MEASVTKGKFAELIGVSPGRVSQYLAEGKITAASLHGHGRNARIIVERAKADLRMGSTSVSAWATGSIRAWTMTLLHGSAPRHLSRL